MTALDGLLSPKQIRSVADADARINIWHGSIRSGKTIASLLRWLIFIATAPPGLLLIVGKTRDTIERNVIEPLQDVRLFGSLTRLIHHTAGSNTAVILGRTVHLIGANDTKSESKLRGATVVGVYVDELTLIPENFFNQLLGRMSVEGAKLFATTNPDSSAHWARKKFLLRAGELDLKHWHFELADNPSLSAAYIAAISLEYVGLWYKRFIKGLWVAAEGAVYDMWDDEVHVVGQAADEHPLPDRDLTVLRWWLGIDYGTTNPFSAVLAGLASNGVVYAIDEWRWDPKVKGRQKTDQEFSADVRGWVETRRLAWGCQPEYWIVDPSAASFKLQLRHDECTATDADNEVLDGIRTVASALESGRHRIHARCTGLAEEMPNYSWDPDATAKGEDKPLKVEDHSCDADRYELFTTKRIWTPYPLTTAA